MEVKLSIVIPVYNVEKYIKKCMLSCLNQDVDSSEYEIIVVNDGTKDRSLSIVESVAKDYSNITIVSQENQGLSAARNRGLSLAQGEYVWFVDSDDWIKEECLGSIIKCLYGLNLDALLISSANIIDGKIERRADRALLESKIFTGEELALMGKWEVCAPFTIYKRRFLQYHNLLFMVGVFHEDVEFSPRSYYFLKRVSIYNEIVYFIYPNPASITRTANLKRSFDLIKICNSLAVFAKSVNDKYSKHISRYIVTGINLSLLNAKDFSRRDLFFLKKDLKINKKIFLHYLYTKKFVFVIEGLLFYCFPEYSISLYRTFNNLFFHRKNRVSVRK